MANSSGFPGLDRSREFRRATFCMPNYGGAFGGRQEFPYASALVRRDAALPIQAFGRRPGFNNLANRYAEAISLGARGGMVMDPMLSRGLSNGEPYQRGYDSRLSLGLRGYPYDDLYRRQPLWSNNGCECESYSQEKTCHDRSCRTACCSGSTSSSNSNSNSDSNSKKSFDFKTKDITIRGKSRAVRASYLTEVPKIEADLVKYMEKKDEDAVPDRVVDMLVSYVNQESYSNKDIVDEVTLNILAFNVGAKSVVDFSLGQIKKIESKINAKDACHIITMIISSNRVDERLKDWLTKFLKTNNRGERLANSSDFAGLYHTRPEVVIELERMLGLRAQQEDGYRNL